MAEDYPRTMLELEQRFPDEAACRVYLFSLRWPAGFVCPHCAGTTGWAMVGNLWLCGGCRAQVSITAGTVLHDSKLPLMIWLRAMWLMTSQKNGISALGLQRVLGLNHYKTAWLLQHKLRRAMVRPGRERLRGVVEVDETHWGSPEAGFLGRDSGHKALIIVAAEAVGAGIGRIRLRFIPDFDRETLHGFVAESVEPGSTVVTDGLNSYLEMNGYVHDRQVQRRQPAGAAHLLPRVHRVIALLKRWLMGTHQGAISHDYLPDYLAEFTFRFNRRHSTSRGKLFYRLAQQAMQIEPTPRALLIIPPPKKAG